jgi:hypothetical protein
MKPVKWPRANGVLKAGGIPGVIDMHVCYTNNPSGTPLVISCWQMSKQELQMIVKTQAVYLGVFGRQIPPMSVHGIEPFEGVPDTLPAIKSLEDINVNTREGRMLGAALAMLTTECRTNKTPYQVIEELSELAEKMYDNQ